VTIFPARKKGNLTAKQIHPRVCSTSYINPSLQASSFFASNLAVMPLARVSFINKYLFLFVPANKLAPSIFHLSGIIFVSSLATTSALITKVGADVD
jgi:hypothetical protein